MASHRRNDLTIHATAGFLAGTLPNNVVCMDCRRAAQHVCIACHSNYGTRAFCLLSSAKHRGKVCNKTDAGRLYERSTLKTLCVLPWTTAPSLLAISWCAPFAALARSAPCVPHVCTRTHPQNHRLVHGTLTTIDMVLAGTMPALKSTSVQV